MPVTKQCERCGKDYPIKPCKAAKSRYCRRDCQSEPPKDEREAKRRERTRARWHAKKAKINAARKAVYQAVHPPQEVEQFPEGFKRCKTCRVVLLLDSFYPQKWCRFGVSNVCKECGRQRKCRQWMENKDRYSASVKRYREANKDKVRVSQRRCYENKRDYYIEKSNTYYHANKATILKKTKEYVRQNAERIRAQKKEYRRRNAEAINARHKMYRGKARGVFTLEQWQDKLNYFGGACYLCKRPLAGLVVHADHRIPLSRGGLNIISNVAPACASCNCSKGAKTEAEYKAYLLEIDQQLLVA